MKTTCIFCKIIARELSATIIEENDDVIVINDINPQAAIHYLIIPKKHISDISQLQPNDHAVAGSLLMMAQKLSEKDERHKQFRLVSNNGPKAGQVVFHIHIHFMADFRHKI